MYIIPAFATESYWEMIIILYDVDSLLYCRTEL